MEAEAVAVDEDESPPIPAGMRYEHGKVVPHLTVEERVARGKAARREVPRSSHAGFTPGRVPAGPGGAAGTAGRDPGARAGADPLRPDAGVGVHVLSGCGAHHGLRPGRDAAVGDHHAGLWRCPPDELRRVRVTGTPARVRHQRLRRDLPGPWEWDVKRLAASFAIAGRDRGFSTKERTRVLLALLGEYRTGMHRFASHDQPGRVVLPHRRRRRHQGAPDRSQRVVRKRAEANVAKARTRDSLQAFDKLTRVVDGQRRIISDPPLIQPIEELVDGMERDQILDFLRAVIRSYRRTLPSDRRHLLEDFRLADVARKVVGVRQCRDTGLDRADARSRRHRPVVPPSQGGRGLGARRVRRAQRPPIPWPTGGARPAPDASQQRHLPRLGPPPGYRRRRARLLRPSTPGLEGRRARRDHEPRHHGHLRPRSVPARWSGPTPAPATGSPSPPTSAPVTPSTGPSSSSPRPTPTKTNGTTTPSSKPRRTAASPPNAASDPTSTLHCVARGRCAAAAQGPAARVRCCPSRTAMTRPAAGPSTW